MSSSAGFGVSVVTSALPLRGALQNFAEKQMPFAVSLALTKTSMGCRAVLQKRVGSIFAARATAFRAGAKGAGAVIANVRAEKTDWPHPFAVIGVRKKSGFLVLHETGGVKRPQKGARRLAIPILDNIKRTVSGRIPKTKKPRAILGKPRGYEAGGVILERKGRRRKKTATKRRRKRKPTSATALYILRKRARITPTLRMERTCTAVARATYGKNFKLALLKAFATARENPGTNGNAKQRAAYATALRTLRS